jgi:hypothetical protein
MKIPTCSGGRWLAAVLLLGLGVMVSAGTGDRNTPHPKAMTLDDFAARYQEYSFLRGEPGDLADHTKAGTMVFRRTRWELKEWPQSCETSSIMERDAMRLPEAERLKVMDRIDNHCQIWTVDLKRFPGAVAVKTLLKPTDLPHETFRELAYLGHDGSLAWYAYMPIYEWVMLQKKLEFKDGDDPLAAAIRGLQVEDRGSMTANSVEFILTDAGARALPYLKPLMDGPNFKRALRVLARIKDPAAETYLVELAQDSRAEIAKTACQCLKWHYYAAALPLYLKWLEADAGRGWVCDILNIMSDQPEKLRPYLPRILASPGSFREYRLAFEISRKLDKKEIPPRLLQIEQEIRKFGYRNGNTYDQAKVDALVTEMAAAEDAAAAAVIAADLAIAITKGDWRPANKAGLEVLSRLPGGQGTQLLEHLLAHCRDDDFKQRIERHRKTVVSRQ